VSTPKFDTTRLNKHIAITVDLYFNFPLVILEKYFAVAEVNPMAVVKHANVTITQRITFPV